MRHLKKFNESQSNQLTVDDVDQVEDLFLSIADKFKIIQVDYPTGNHVFQDEDELIYRMYAHFWNAGKTATLIDNDWDSEIQKILIRVVALGWFETMNYTGESHYEVPQDVYDTYSDLVDELDRFRERLVKFGYKVLPIKTGSDYYTELVNGEEITTNGIYFTIEISSKL